ncbi:hypothetical protein PV410_34370 [Streptomyces sp. PA03-5A]|nr:hypothetical protein [Streptomyces sp. PA03-5A]
MAEAVAHRAGLRVVHADHGRAGFGVCAGRVAADGGPPGQPGDVDAVQQCVVRAEVGPRRGVASPRIEGSEPFPT